MRRVRGEGRGIPYSMIWGAMHPREADSCLLGGHTLAGSSQDNEWHRPVPAPPDFQPAPPGALPVTGRGAVYTYDAIGSYERVGYGCQGSGKELMQPVLDSQLKAASPLLLPQQVKAGPQLSLGLWRMK